MPKLIYHHASKPLTETRLTMFEMFRETLSDEERAALDRKMKRWIDIMSAPRSKGGFGIAAARELYMALQSFCDCKPIH